MRLLDCNSTVRQSYKVCKARSRPPTSWFSITLSAWRHVAHGFIWSLPCRPQNKIAFTSVLTMLRVVVLLACRITLLALPTTRRDETIQVNHQTKIQNIINHDSGRPADATHAGTDSGHLKVAWPVSRAITGILEPLWAYRMASQGILRLFHILQ
eukprot:6197543-Pleurochrysis_carterae.AAC.4